MTDPEYPSRELPEGEAPAAARADRRGEILDAALALLGRRGFAGFSASALAAEVGVSKATLFHHFRSLDEVPLLALDRMLAGLVTPDLPPEAGLGALVEAFGAGTFALAETRPEILRAYCGLAAAAMTDARLGARLAGSLAAWTETVAASLASRMAEPARSRELAALLLAFLDGAVMQLLIDASAAGPHAAWAALRGMIEREFADANRH